VQRPEQPQRERIVHGTMRPSLQESGERAVTGDVVCDGVEQIGVLGRSEPTARLRLQFDRREDVRHVSSDPTPVPKPADVRASARTNEGCGKTVATLKAVMAFLRRVATVLAIAGIAALVLRVKGRATSRPMDGGWQPLASRDE